jgi:transforming growth factor-beta-induced protein
MRREDRSNVNGQMEKSKSINSFKTKLIDYRKMQLSQFSLFALAVSQSALDIVLGSADHKTLAQLAGTIPAVVDVLKSAGPLTLFAPNDAAFAKLDKAVVDAVTSNSALLTQVLQYHVIAGAAFDPATAEPKSFPKTALGPALGVTVNHGAVSLAFGLGTSNVTASVKATNGVVHVVDTVLIPPGSASATAIAGKFTQLVAALQKANLVETVDGAKDITIFAPTDKAFEEFTAFAQANKVEVTDDLLKRVLTLHVVPSVVYSTDIAKAKTVIETNALSQEPLTVQLKDGAVLVAGKGNTKPATVAIADVIFDKGVVHAIDAVLLPDLKAAAPSPASGTAPKTPATTNTPNTISSAVNAFSVMGLVSGLMLAL